MLHSLFDNIFVTQNKYKWHKSWVACRFLFCLCFSTAQQHQHKLELFRYFCINSFTRARVASFAIFYVALSLRLPPLHCVYDINKKYCCYFFMHTRSEWVRGKERENESLFISTSSQKAPLLTLINSSLFAFCQSNIISNITHTIFSYLLELF